MRTPVDDAIASIRRAVQDAGDDFREIGKPADPKQIKWFGDRLLNWRWPPTYTAVLRKHDGVAFVTPILFSFRQSIDVFLVFRDHWFRDRRRWPVGGDGCGSYWVLNLEEQRDDGECPVRFVDHEDGPLSDGRPAGDTYAEFVVNLFNRNDETTKD